MNLVEIICAQVLLRMSRKRNNNGNESKDHNHTEDNLDCPRTQRWSEYFESLASQSDIDMKKLAEISKTLH